MLGLLSVVLLFVSGAASAGPKAYRTVTIAKGLVHPWGMAFLPGGRMLVTERPGRLRIVSKDGTISKPVSGLPKIAAVGQRVARRGAASRIR